MKKLTVLHISPAPPQLGGMEAFMGDLLHSALRRKVNLLHLDISKPALQKGGRYGIGTGYAAIRQRGLRQNLRSYGYSLIFFYRFVKLLLLQTIDILHIHTASYTSFWEKCLYVIIGRFSGNKVILHVHGALFDQFYQNSSACARALIRFFLARAHAVIVLSQFWLDFFTKNVPKAKLRLVENGIDLAPYLALLPYEGRPTLLHIGEISRRKGIDDLLAVLAEIKALDVDFHLHLAGGGELDHYERMIDRLQLHEHVTLHGPVRGSAKLKLFSDSNIFILASYAEGLPIALIEALAAALPVIVTDVGGIPDVIINGRNGWLCKPGDRGALRDHCLALIRQAQLRQTMGLTNRSYAETRFDINRCVEHIVAVYRNICGIP